MCKSKILLKISLIVLALSCIAVIGFASVKSAKPAFAAPREKNFEVKQTSVIYYCGNNYLANDDLINDFLSGFSIEFDGVKFDANAGNTSIYCDTKIIKPSNYLCDFTVNDGENDYTFENVPVKITKKAIDVTVYLNGERELTISQTEKVYISYDYVGAVEGDYYWEEENGVRVRKLYKELINTVAYVQYIPPYIVTNYSVAAANATSDYYVFNYNKSLLTVVDQKVQELVFSNENGNLVYLIGEYSSASKLNFIDVGVVASSEKYAEISQSIEEKYVGKDLLKNYEPIACYSIDVSISGETVDVDSSIVRIKLDDNLKDKSKYKVVALYSNGDDELIDALENVNGELMFSAKHMGDFVVYSPVEGIKPTTYIIVVSIGIVFVLLVIFFVALFRKKY